MTYKISEIEVVIRLIVTTCASRILPVVQADIVVLSIHVRGTHCCFSNAIVAPHVDTGVNECIG